MSMSLQSTYNSAPAIAYAGQLEGDHNDIDSMKNATASTSMPFGSPVKLKSSPSTDKDADVISGSGDQVFGIVVHSHAYARQWTDSDGNLHGELDSVGLVPGTIINVLRRGRIAVLCTKAAAVGNQLHVAYNGSGGNYSAAGQMGGVADTGHTIKVSATEFVTSCSDGGFAWLEADFVASVSTAD